MVCGYIFSLVFTVRKLVQIAARLSPACYTALPFRFRKCKTLLRIRTLSEDRVQGTKLSTTPANDVEFEGGETAPVPIPRFANPALTVGKSPGSRAETADKIPSFACVKVGRIGVSFRPPITYVSMRFSAVACPCLATRLTNTSHS